jgi:hypothetical protein
MAEPRRLRITILVDDDGGPEDYTQITDALSSIGAEIELEEEVDE